jgi:predicted NBD/HSP70 family sugar kinase
VIELVAVEVGGSGIQTVVFDSAGSYQVHEGVRDPAAGTVALAVPGILSGSRVTEAPNLDWYDVDPAHEIGLTRAPAFLMNDAEAAALGEAALRAGVMSLLLVSLGTGVGAARVRDGEVEAANLLAHEGTFGRRVCRCGQVGCLETVAAGWALPEHLTPRDKKAMAQALAQSLTDAVQESVPPLVVLAGGITRRHPDLIAMLAGCLPGWEVEGSASPDGAKSAAAWGLLSRHRAPLPGHVD